GNSARAGRPACAGALDLSVRSRVRAAARRLARDGRVVVTRGGEVCDPDADWRGPIRIAQPPFSASGSIRANRSPRKS
ncbi:UNVERIFIED_CONTAM: DUF3253 domain-containing protein, partial [Salmonella enterica subsp. enterica serovar Weltevreden]